MILSYHDIDIRPVDYELNVTGSPSLPPSLSLALPARVEDNPFFYCCARVYLPYCSGDLYSGGGESHGDGSVIYFHGFRIVRAMFERLNIISPLASFERVLLAGASAGSVGVALHAQDLVSLYWPTAVVGLLLDSGWFLDVTRFSQERSSLVRNVLPMAIELWNSSKFLSSSCVEPQSLQYRCYLQTFMARSSARLPTLYMISEADIFYPSRALQSDEENGSIDISSLEISSLSTFLTSLGGETRQSFQQIVQLWEVTVSH